MCICTDLDERSVSYAVRSAESFLMRSGRDLRDFLCDRAWITKSFLLSVVAHLIDQPNLIAVRRFAAAAGRAGLGRCVTISGCSPTSPRQHP